MENDIQSIAVNFVKTLQNRASAGELLRFYHPDIEQTEFPNAITKNTAIRNLDDMRRGAEKGSKVLLKEEYEILRSFTCQNNVILEVTWTGTLAIPMGSIPVGGQMKAHFAQFFEFEGDKIIRIRNYDCFEPFG